MKKFKLVTKAFNKLLLRREWPVDPTIDIWHVSAFDTVILGLDPEVPNAKCYSDTGEIYINTAYLDYINTEAEAALCIAHELGHIFNQDKKSHRRTLSTLQKEIEADIFAHILLKEAGYCPIKASDVHTRICAGLSKDSLLIEAVPNRHPPHDLRTYIYHNGSLPESFNYDLFTIS